MHSNLVPVTATASTLVAYVLGVPTALFLTLKYRSPTRKCSQSLVQFVCLYGYVLTAFIPIVVGGHQLIADPLQILWTIDISVVRWSLLGVGAALTALTLVFAVWPALRADLLAPTAPPLVAAVLVVVHCAVLFALKAASNSIESSLIAVLLRTHQCAGRRRVDDRRSPAARQCDDVTVIPCL